MVTKINERKPKHGGRLPFGFRTVGSEKVLTDEGRAVLERIVELRKSGYTYREIQEDEGVHHLNGKKMSISTIQYILMNIERYGL